MGSWLTDSLKDTSYDAIYNNGKTSWLKASSNDFTDENTKESNVIIAKNFKVNPKIIAALKRYDAETDPAEKIKISQLMARGVF